MKIKNFKQHILIFLLCTLVTLLASCSLFFNQKNSSDKNDFTVTLSGTLDMNLYESLYQSSTEALNETSDYSTSSRSAFPVIPETIYYTLIATETSSSINPKPTVTGTVHGTGSSATFTIKLTGNETGKTWNIAACGYKTRTANGSSYTYSDLIFSGTKEITINLETNNNGVYFEDLKITVNPVVTADTGNGNVSLPVKIESGSSIKSCVAKWTEGSGAAATVKTQTLSFTEQAAVFTMIPDSEMRTTTPSGIYDVDFYFYTDSSLPTYRLVGFVKETVNVYDNLTTTVWENNSSTETEYLFNDNGTCKLYYSNAMVTSFEKNTRFVDAVNGHTLASGSYQNPFNSITKALDVIKELYSTAVTGTSTPEYRIFLLSDVTLDGDTETPSTSNYAFLNLSESYFSSETEKIFKLDINSYSSGINPYKIDANRSSTNKGRVIFIGDNAQLTLCDIQITGGYLEDSNDTDFFGAGIFKTAAGKLNLGGKILINNSTKRTWDFVTSSLSATPVDSNLFLDTSNITIVAALTGSEIHLTSNNLPSLAGTNHGADFTNNYSLFNNGSEGSPQFPGTVFISDDGYNIGLKTIDNLHKEAAFVISGGEINTHFVEPIKFYVNKATIESCALEAGENGTDASYEKHPRTITFEAWTYFEDAEDSPRRKNWTDSLDNITMNLKASQSVSNNTKNNIIATANQNAGVNTNTITIPYGIAPAGYMLEISADFTDDYGIKNRYNSSIPVTVENNLIIELEKTVFVADEEVVPAKIIFNEDDFLQNNKEFTKKLYKNNTLCSFDGHMPAPSQDLILEIGVTIDEIIYAKRIPVQTIDFPIDIVSTSDGLLENNSTFSSGTLTINPSVLIDSENQTYSKIPDKTTIELVNSNNDSVFIYDLLSTKADNTFSLNIPVDLDGGLYKLIILRNYKGVENTTEVQFTKYAHITSLINISKMTFTQDEVYSFVVTGDTFTNNNLAEMISSVGVSSGCLELDLSNLSNLTTLDFNSAKNYLHKIKSLILPDSLTTIASGALYQATKLETITIPASVTVISSSALHTCSALKKVIFAPRTQTLTIKEVSFAGTGLETITIPKEAVYGPVSPNSVFRGSNKLKEFIIEEGNTCFKTAHNNEILLINNGKTLLDWPAAEGDIKEEYFENPIEIISRSCFDGNKKMTSIEIPASVTKICGSAFAGVTSLTTVTFKDPDNWYIGSSDVPTAATISSYTPLDLSDTAQNAKYLTKFFYSGAGGYAEKTFHHYIPE